jgi:hypothetical protein
MHQGAFAFNQFKSGSRAESIASNLTDTIVKDFGITNS